MAVEKIKEDDSRDITVIKHCNVTNWFKILALDKYTQLLLEQKQTRNAIFYQLQNIAQNEQMRKYLSPRILVCCISGVTAQQGSSINKYSPDRRRKREVSCSAIKSEK